MPEILYVAFSHQEPLFSQYLTNLRKDGKIIRHRRGRYYIPVPAMDAIWAKITTLLADPEKVRDIQVEVLHQFEIPPDVSLQDFYANTLHLAKPRAEVAPREGAPRAELPHLPVAPAPDTSALRRELESTKERCEKLARGYQLLLSIFQEATAANATPTKGLIRVAENRGTKPSDLQQEIQQLGEWARGV